MVLRALYLVCLIFAAASLSEGSGREARREQVVRDLVGKIDRDENGVVDSSEIQANFDSYDTINTQDGSVTRDEWVAGFLANNPNAPRMIARMAAKKMFSKMDNNGDGFVVLQEMSPPAEADADGNGILTTEELAAHIISLMLGEGVNMRMQALRAAAARTDQDQNGEISSWELREAFNGYDENADGHITRQEWTNRFAERNPEIPARVASQLSALLFSRVDADGNGVVTRDEMIPDLSELDLDGVGGVSIQEFEIYMQSQLETRGQSQLSNHYPGDGHQHIGN